jgi:polynucleotide 5'-hydroxyl-kinase GRC3/NOL9
MEIIPECEWQGIIEELIQYKGTAVLLGTSDAGKSTLTKYLIKELLANRIKVSLVDSDVGQSSLGLPGTICMKRFSRWEDFDNFKPDKIFFIGDVNPARKVPLMIYGTKKMVSAARSEGAKIILVDTTGLIAGSPGRTLKIGKMKAIKPGHIIALQKRDELEHILSLIEDVRIYRLRVSSHVKRRRREKRLGYRKKKYAEYFRGAMIKKYPYKGLSFFYNRRKIDIQKVSVETGRLVGINRNGDTIALGIFKGVRHDVVAIKSPLKSFDGINRIIIGDISLADF